MALYHKANEGKQEIVMGEKKMGEESVAKGLIQFENGLKV
jgi:hypothetical protein